MKNWRQQALSLRIQITLDTLNLASEEFHTFEFSRLMAIFILSTLVSIRNNLYKNIVELATLKLAVSTRKK